LGCWVAESDANFIWVRLPGEDAEARAALESTVLDGLRARGVLVRAGGALGEAGALRITVGTERENAKLVRALGEILA
jgi:histidinol-phosphate/aromatic aminotransferase/cobyric acid decarboxylase-like protein